MQKMLEDLDFAIEHLPSRNNEAEAPYKVTKGAALAFKSRVCLFEGTYRKYHNLRIEGHDADWPNRLMQQAS